MAVKRNVKKKGKKEHKASKTSKKSSYYKIEGNTLTREKRSCPKCGHGVFMAEHENRYHCGKCGFSEFKKKPIAEKAEEKPQTETPKENKE